VSGRAALRLSTIGVRVPREPASGTAILTPYSVDPLKGMALAEEAAKLAGVELRRSENLDQIWHAPAPSSTSRIRKVSAPAFSSVWRTV